MESISSILKHRGKSYSVNELPKEATVKLSPVELKIIEKRLSGLSFCQLTGDELKRAADHLLLKASAIVGCPLPETDFYAEALTNEIVEFLNEMGYGELTVDEIVFAMRLNSKGGLRYPSGVDVETTTFKGAYFNLDFLSKVLGTYATLRGMLNRKLQNYLDGYE